MQNEPIAPTSPVDAPEPVSAIHASLEHETRASEPPARPAFKVGDRFILTDDDDELTNEKVAYSSKQTAEPIREPSRDASREEKIAYLGFVASRHEAGHLVCWTEVLRFEAYARIEWDGGRFTGETLVPEIERATRQQMIFTAVAGAVGEHVALNLPLSAESVRARMSDGDLSMCPNATDEVLLLAAGVVEKLLRGPLNAVWIESADAMLEAV